MAGTERERSHESQPTAKINKLIVGFDNGKARYLEGEEAASFVAQIDSVASYTQIRISEDIPQPKWKWIDATEVGRLFEELPTNMSSKNI